MACVAHHCICEMWEGANGNRAMSQETCRNCTQLPSREGRDDAAPDYKVDPNLSFLEKLGFFLIMRCS